MRKNITFPLWKKTITTLFSWGMWKNLIILSAIPVVMHLILLQILGTEFFGVLNEALLAGDLSLFFEASHSLMIVQFLLLVLLLIEMGILIVATLHITVRESFTGGENSLVRNLFEKAPDIFIPFHFYLARVFWYTVWPFFLFLAVLGLVSQIGAFSFVESLSVFVVVFTLYRVLRVAFALPFYFEYHSDTHVSRKEIFERSLEYSKGHVLSLFLSAVGLGIILILALFVFFVLFAGILTPELFLGDMSLFLQLILLLPNILFEGVITVFFYVLYKVMQQEERDADQRIALV